MKILYGKTFNFKRVLKTNKQTFNAATRCLINMRCKITVNKYTEVGKIFALFGENRKYQINSAFLFLKNFGNDV